MASLKALKIRIGSVKSTQKITKAMKMVAAAKLRRAQQAAGEQEAATADRGAAGGEPTEPAIARGLRVEMERLRIECGSKDLEPLLIQP